MAEKKKRVRPTLTQVRALEAEIAELKDTIKFSDGVSGVELKKKFKELEDSNKALEAEKHTLEISNRHMEDELTRLRKEFSMANTALDKKNDEIYKLKNRGFFDRLFNRE